MVNCYPKVTLTLGSLLQVCSGPLDVQVDHCTGVSLYFTRNAEGSYSESSIYHLAWIETPALWNDRQLFLMSQMLLFFVMVVGHLLLRQLHVSISYTNQILNLNLTKHNIQPWTWPNTISTLEPYHKRNLEPNWNPNPIFWQNKAQRNCLRSKCGVTIWDIPKPHLLLL